MVRRRKRTISDLETSVDAVLEQLEQQTAKTIGPVTPPPPPPRGRSMKVRWFAILILASIAVGSYWTYRHYKDRITTDDAQVDGHVAPIAAKISGNIVDIAVEDNQRVKAGQALVRIDTRDYDSRVAQARAALAMAESQERGARVTVPLTAATTEIGGYGADAQLAAALSELERAKTDYDRASSAELAYARANVATQQATFDRARADLERMKPLVAREEISKIQYDAYDAGARVAQAQLDASRDRLAAAEKQSEMAKAGYESARARVDQARAAVRQSQVNRRQVDISASHAASASAAVLQARANLEARQLEQSYTTITAPIDGVVTRKTVQIGQIVQPGQSLMTIIPLEDVWVTANFKETQLARVRSGQKAEVHVDMYSRTFTAHVDSIAGATGARLSVLPPENATGNYVKVVQRIPVKLVFDGIPDGFVFRPGMNVNASIFTK